VGVINTAVDLAVLNTLIAISHRGRSWASVQPLQSDLVPGCSAQQLLAKQPLDVPLFSGRKYTNARWPVRLD